MVSSRFEPTDVGWRVGKAVEPRAGDLWCPWDRTAGAIGPQGSGKTLDLLIPALLSAPGGALTTLTKPEDLLLSFTQRTGGGRPALVLDPFGAVDGLPELIWDPIEGCRDPMVAERRAKAFAAGTIKATGSGGSGDAAARFYAAEAAKVLQTFFHAAALADKTMETVVEWVARPQHTNEPGEILRNHASAAPYWHGLLMGALYGGDERTTSNTVTTVQQAMALFFQPAIRRRCVPSWGRPATDIASVIAAGGTFYLLGREDPYASASPLMTALTEHILDTALQMAMRSPWGKLCPPFLTCLDEMPSTAPLPTLRTRMANERALGLSFIWAAQTWQQLVTLFNEHEARNILGLTNVLVTFGGSKDVGFNKEVSELVGTTRVARTSWHLGGQGGRTSHGDDMVVMKPEEVRQIPEKHALILPENAKPIVAVLRRSVEGKKGARLLSDAAALRREMERSRDADIPEDVRAAAASAVVEPDGDGSATR